MNPALQMKRYFVNSVSFEMNEKFRPEANKTIKLNPSFKRMVMKVDDNNAIIKLTMELVKSDELPFSISATVSGLFELAGWTMSDVLVRAIEDMSVNLLYPYLRALVTNITANAGVPPYILPVINIAALFRSQGEATGPVSTPINSNFTS